MQIPTASDLLSRAQQRFAPWLIDPFAVVAEAIGRRAAKPQPALGVDRMTGRPVVVPWQLIPEHCLTVGATGVGKTTTCTRLAAAVITAGGPSLTVDLKGDADLAHQLAAWAHAAGRDFYWFRLGHQAIRYDPLAAGDPSERASKLLGFSNWSEAHYEAVAEYLVTLALRAADASAEGRPSLGRVTDLLHVETLQSMTTGGALPLPLSREISRETDDLPRDQVSALVGLRRRLQGITGSTAGEALEPSSAAPTINLRDVMVDGGPVVLASLDSMRYGSLAGSVAAMMLEDVRAALSHRRGRFPGLVWVDEFENVAGQGLRRLLSRARSSGVGVLLSTQDLADLRAADEHLVDQTIGNVRTLILHAVRVRSSAEYLAAALADDEVAEDTVHINRDGLGVERPTGRASRQRAREWAVQPSEIQRLGRGSALVAIHSEDDSRAHVHRCAVRLLRPPALPEPPEPASITRVHDEREGQEQEDAA